MKVDPIEDSKDKVLDQEEDIDKPKGDRELPRIDLNYILNEISSVLSFKKGILYTIRELILRPGRSIRTFIEDDRNKLVKPVIFVIFCSFLYTVLQRFLGFDDGFFRLEAEDKELAAMMIFSWIQDNYGYTNILMSLFIALWIKVLFKKYGYNFFELLILLFYVSGFNMLVYALLGVIEIFSGIKLFSAAGIIGFLYSNWAIAQFFDGRRVLNYFKAAISYFLGLVIFTIAVIAVSIVIEILVQ